MCAVNPVQFSRDENGQIIVNFSNAENFDVINVGKINGSVSMQVGSTGETEELGVSFVQNDSDESASVKLANSDGRNYSFTGCNFNISAQGGSASRMITMDTVNSNLNLSNTSGINCVLMSETGGFNAVALGYGNDVYLDNGMYNIATDKGGANTFETGTTSIGAIISAGNGADVFKIGGSYGVINAGGGNDTIATLGHMTDDGDDNYNYSYRNVIIGGDGDDYIIDHGAYNLFFGESGFDTYVGSGDNGIANLGFGEEEGGSATFNDDAIDSYAFSTIEQTDERTGRVYNYYDVLRSFNWSLDDFLSADQSGFDALGLKSLIYDKLYELFLGADVSGNI